ncbi:hypothetical protein GS501_00015 [Saccharibacter sp. 17.LH.SD]|uniref:hypothetical protein n=1 Tax=Saccharibacter sp. 17.LH.SD TaxID=2689393 RepID=UPI00136CBD1A|nr:hypothetical protein [Saccharibacter sp. 17.LH.SD]MXV43465.1 hypothetical protein [Saccharibacter sp. 17.LH.SD]
MPKIHLGVSQQAYDGGKTTADVARILEARYGLFSRFVAANAEWIQERLEAAFETNIAEALVTGIVPASPYRVVAQQLQAKLQEAINSGSIERMGLGPGKVPTQAAIDGVNHRFKSGFNNVSPSDAKRFRREQAKLPRGERKRLKGDPRPSFRDTGIFERALMAWAEEN